jgi:carbon monoxide dehydrogenase subunit G
MRYENSVAINRPVEDVFAYMTCIENSPTWQNAVLEARQTSSGPLGVGTTYVGEGKVLGRQFESTAAVTAWNPPHSYAIKTTSGPLRLAIQITLAARGQGTWVDAVSEVEASGFFKVAGPMLEQVLKRQAQQDLETLKAILESRDDATNATS